MNSKLIIIAIVVIIALAFIAFNLISSMRNTSVAPIGGTTVTSEESSILDDQIPAISQDQLNAVSAEDPTFLSDMQNRIAADMSIFYYE